MSRKSVTVAYWCVVVLLAGNLAIAQQQDKPPRRSTGETQPISRNTLQQTRIANGKPVNNLATDTFPDPKQVEYLMSTLAEVADNQNLTLKQRIAVAETRDILSNIQNIDTAMGRRFTVTSMIEGAIKLDARTGKTWWFNPNGFGNGWLEIKEGESTRQSNDHGLSDAVPPPTEQPNTSSEKKEEKAKDAETK